MRKTAGEKKNRKVKKRSKEVENIRVGGERIRRREDKYVRRKSK